MKMISSVKLRKAERDVNSFKPYEQSLGKIMNNYLTAANGEEQISLTISRDVKKIAIVVFSSNSSLCGAYNGSVIKKLEQVIKSYNSIASENIIVFPIGKKVRKACEKFGLTTSANFDNLADSPTYEQVADLAKVLIQQFENQEIDLVKLIYFQYKSKSKQSLQTDTFLPVEPFAADNRKSRNDYIIEPSRAKILELLLPQILCSKMYSAALDACASEHAARLIAMQTATDNADDLLQELSLQYNKLRQQAITNELLDIAGGQI